MQALKLRLIKWKAYSYNKLIKIDLLQGTQHLAGARIRTIHARINRYFSFTHLLLYR